MNGGVSALKLPTTDLHRICRSGELNNLILPSVNPVITRSGDFNNSLLTSPNEAAEGTPGDVFTIDLTTCR